MHDVESIGDEWTGDNGRYLNYDLYCRGSYVEADIPEVDGSIRIFHYNKFNF